MPREAGKNSARLHFKLTARTANSRSAGDRCAECVCYLLLLAGCDAVEKWQGQGATCDGFGERKVALLGPAACAPSRLQVDGREVAAGCDALLEERSLHSSTAGSFGQSDDIDKPTELAAGEREWRDARGREFPQAAHRNARRPDGGERASHRSAATERGRERRPTPKADSCSPARHGRANRRLDRGPDS